MMPIIQFIKFWLHPCDSYSLLVFTRVTPHSTGRTIANSTMKKTVSSILSSPSRVCVPMAKYCSLNTYYVPLTLLGNQPMARTPFMYICIPQHSRIWNFSTDEEQCGSLKSGFLRALQFKSHKWLNTNDSYLFKRITLCFSIKHMYFQALFLLWGTCSFDIN